MGCTSSTSERDELSSGTLKKTYQINAIPINSGPLSTNPNPSLSSPHSLSPSHPSQNSSLPKEILNDVSSQSLSKVIDVAPKKQSEILYSGIREGMGIFCLDYFNSKYTGEDMARWRAATIKQYQPEFSKVLIHFEGWKDKHDVYLTLPADLNRLAPGELLTDQEKLDGRPLTEIQHHIVQVYLQTGYLELDETVAEHDNPVGPSTNYIIGQLIDVQDIYKPKNKTQVVAKWRPGEIKEVNGRHVTIHYIGWGEEWDDVIDTAVESHRIRPPGTQITRRSPSKKIRENSEEGTLLAAHANDQTSSKNRGDELLTYKGRKRSIPRDLTSQDEQRRGSFTSNISKGTDQVGMKVRQQKISVQSLPANRLPESEMLFDSKSKFPLKKNHSFQDSVDFPIEGNGREIPLTSATTRELHRAYSSPTPSKSNSFADLQSSLPDDEEIPPEIDESEYYETLEKEKSFFEAMNHYGFHIVEMDGDGNCLFRSVAHQIYLDEDRHYELRQQCVEHLEKHYRRFSGFYPGKFRDYLKNMKKPGVWGDDIEIKALEEITDRLIHIYSSHSSKIEPLPTNFDEREVMRDVKPILLSYHGRNHYNSVFDENTPLPLEPRESKILLTMRSKANQTAV